MAQAARKGILLAGGANSRLLPATRAVPKSLLPVYDRPLIYYPLSLLIAAGVRDILLIAAPGYAASHRMLLGDGAGFGVNITYTEQEKPRGIADAFIIGESFIGGAPSMLVLADNIFCGGGAARIVKQASAATSSAQVLAKRVPDPHRFGVITMDGDGKPLTIVEKPTKPDSDWAVTGCYFYDGGVCDIAKGLKPSGRGELEITDINDDYLRRGMLGVSCLPDDAFWLDAGTAESLLAAANALCDTKDPDGLGAPELAAYKQGWISEQSLRQSAAAIANAPYCKALQL